jgi:hypothetical protein
MSSNSNAKDALVRASLAEYGDDGHLPRHTLFYFYGGNFSGLGTAASAAGYKIRPTAKNDGVILETTISVDEASFNIHLARIEAWVEEFECEYDGWECEMVKQ